MRNGTRLLLLNDATLSFFGVGAPSRRRKFSIIRARVHERSQAYVFAGVKSNLIE